MLEPLAEHELGLLVLDNRPDELLAGDLERQRRQMLASEIGRDIGRRKQEMAVTNVHDPSIRLQAATSYTLAAPTRRRCP